jgi:phage N-6-adenine-methyltransferase
MSVKCMGCRRSFKPKRSDAKTCSDACRQMARRRRLGVPKRHFNVTRSRDVRNVHFASTTDLWSTPQDLFDRLNTEFEFTLDVCATPENAKCTEFYTMAEDGLAQPWEGVPYGRAIGKWMHKALMAATAGATVVALVPARTDTKWWHDYATKGEIRFLPGRLKFGGGEHSAPFPSAVVVFRAA